MSEQLNAASGQFAMHTVAASTRGIASSDERVSNRAEDMIQGPTAQRDTVASQIKVDANAAAFDGQPLDEQEAKLLIVRTQALLAQAHALSGE